MYELLLTALVEDGDFAAACAVLGGLCAMPPWETTDRVLYFQGPPRPAGIANQGSIDKPMRKDVAFLYKELHQSLSRQSFVLQARYEVAKDRDLGPQATPQDLDATPGILRWADFPDPPHARPALTQRKIVELWEQKKLLSVMRDNHYRQGAPSSPVVVVAAVPGGGGGGGLPADRPAGSRRRRSRRCTASSATKSSFA